MFLSAEQGEIPFNERKHNGETVWSEKFPARAVALAGNVVGKEITITREQR